MGFQASLEQGRCFCMDGLGSRLIMVRSLQIPTDGFTSQWAVVTLNKEPMIVTVSLPGVSMIPIQSLYNIPIFLLSTSEL